MPVYIHNDIKLLDPATSLFADVDYGNNSQGLILLNILMELRVMTQYLYHMNQGVMNDTPEQLRSDVCSDPSSLLKNTTTSNF